MGFAVASAGCLGADWRVVCRRFDQMLAVALRSPASAGAASQIAVAVPGDGWLA